MKNIFARSLCAVVLACTLVASLSSCFRAATPKGQNKATEAVPTAADTKPVETEPPVTYETEIILDETDTSGYDALVVKMQENPKLETFKTGANVLTADEYMALCKINPDTKIYSKVTFEDTVMDLSLEEVDISEKKIADKTAFDTLVSHFPAGVKLVMCDCGYTNEEMGALREKYPDLHFAWRLYLGERWNLRTDDEAFSVMIYHYQFTRMTSEDIQILKYCTNMYALDLGHQAITDISILGELKDLRVLILADNKITDISPLAKLKNLQYLELFVNKISDLSPLAECTELVDLNFGWNRAINDVSCIYNLEKIERLWLPTTGVPVAARAEIEENFPGAQFVYADKDSISSGWRTHKRYFLMRGMFNENKYNPDFTK